MLRYNLLFIHVASAMGLFTALGMEALALAQLRRAQDAAAARAALAALGSNRRVSGPSMLLLVLSGLALTAAYWRGQGAWIGLGLAGMVAIGAVGGLVTGRRVGRLQQGLAGGEPGASLSEAYPALRASFIMRTALLAGVVYLMTVKPAPAVALGALGVAIVVGLLLSRVPHQREATMARSASR
ncbi:MAG: DUF2269 family protein [Gemmatimonadaceae bacterium]